MHRTTHTATGPRRPQVEAESLLQRLVTSRTVDEHQSWLGPGKCPNGRRASYPMRKILPKPQRGAAER